MNGSQVNANDGIMVIHMLKIVGNCTPYFFSKGLLGYKVNSRPGIGINEDEAHKFEPPLDCRGTA